MRDVTLPAGEVVGRWRGRIAEIPKRKWFYVKVTAAAGSGWLIFRDREFLAAAYCEQRGEKFLGLKAVAKVVSLEGTVEVGLLGERVVELFLAIHPDVAVLRDFSSALAESKALNSEVAAPVEQFTEEWEAGEAKAEECDEAGGEEESAEKSAERGEEKKSEPKTVRKWVVSFERFLAELGNFTGVCRGRGGNFYAEVYVENGEVVGALAREDDVEVKGEAALFFLDRPLEVEVIEGSFEVPEDLRCEEEKRSVEVFYEELDRRIRP